MFVGARYKGLQLERDLEPFSRFARKSCATDRQTWTWVAVDCISCTQLCNFCWVDSNSKASGGGGVVNNGWSIRLAVMTGLKFAPAILYTELFWCLFSDHLQSHAAATGGLEHASRLHPTANLAILWPGLIWTRNSGNPFSPKVISQKLHRILMWTRDPVLLSGFSGVSTTFGGTPIHSAVFALWSRVCDRQTTRDWQTLGIVGRNRLISGFQWHSNASNCHSQLLRCDT